MSKNKELDSIIAEYVNMGFDTQNILMAWMASNQRKTAMLDYLLNPGEKNAGGDLTSSIRGDDRLSQTQYFEEQTQKAIQLSIEENVKSLKPDQLLRTPNNLVGLQNVGNSCYFNALIQTLFQIEEFLEIILRFIPPYDVQKTLFEMEIEDPKLIQRKKDCVTLVLELQKLAALMLFGNKSVLDPSTAMKAVIDSQGNKVKIGEQSDITEFSINFFERIEEGLALDARPKSEQEQNETKGINELFFGKSQDFISFEWADFKTKKRLESSFGPINLSMINKDLMSALEAYTDFFIEDYQTPNGQITTAKKRLWITNPPRVFNFVIPRLEFIKDIGLTKIADTFEFPKEIFIDRFLYNKKKELHSLVEERKSLKNKERKIVQEIFKLQKFANTDLKLTQVLEATDLFLNQQMEEMEKDFVEVGSDSSEERLAECASSQELKRFSEVLKQYQESVNKKLASLEQKKESTKKKIENSFQDFQNAKFTLHSVVVHEGGAHSGHYYSFIYDPTHQKWRKYNDAKITEVSEEEVFSCSFGGATEANLAGKNTCAYSLLYIKDDCKVINFEENRIKELKKLLSKDMLSFIENENNRFFIEYQHYNGNISAKIFEEYIESMRLACHEAVNIQGEIKNKVFPFVPLLINFNTFLLSDVPKCSEIARWNLLKGILSYKKVPYDILEGQSNNFYYTELKDLIVNNSCHYALKSMELTEANKQLLMEKKMEFIELNKCFAIVKSIFELILNNKWKEAMATISLLHNKLTKLKPNQDIVKQFFQFAAHLLTLVALRFCALIDKKHLAGETQEAQEFLEILIYSLNNKHAIKPTELIHQQICSNLHYSIDFTSVNNIKEADMIIFKHHVQKIQEKQEFLPSNISALISQELLQTLTNIDTNDTQFYISDKQNTYELEKLYDKVCHEKLKIWVEIEDYIRKGKTLFDQEHRIEKEMITWVNE